MIVAVRAFTEQEQAAGVGRAVIDAESRLHVLILDAVDLVVKCLILDQERQPAGGIGKHLEFGGCNEHESSGGVHVVPNGGFQTRVDFVRRWGGGGHFFFFFVKFMW